VLSNFNRCVKVISLKMKQEIKTCQNCKKDFMIEPEDFNFYEKIKVPPPTWCSECRAMRRMLWRNERSLYHHTCALSGKKILSILNLQNCLGCVNLRHKTHCILNRQYTKEGYNKKIKEYDFGSYKFLQSFKDEYKKFLLKQPRRFASILKSVSVTGDNVIHSKNSKMIFDAYGDVEDSKYLTHTLTIKNSYDGYGIGYNAELLYEGVDFGLDAARNFFGIFNHRGLDTQYTYMCYSSKNLFGCVGLRSKQYCILNKQYTKGEYEKLVPQIIAQMNDMPYVDKKGRVYKYGEFFPTEFSPFYYNETIAQEYYPLTEKRASDFGFKWKNKDKRDYQIDISTENLPDHIKNVEESIVGKVIECIHKGGCEEQCIEAFKITSDELQFYKRNNIALPRLCPNCRHFQRLKKRNPLKLWHRGCMCGKQNHFHGKEKCKVKFETSYASGRPEIVYCEKCYQAEVY